ncbi:MAG: hypothetical protein ACJ79H_00660 [Myxococcales bacterium]
MSYSVHYRVKLDSVPEPARDEIRRTMDQIGEALDTVPPSSPFWTSTKDSVLQIDVMKWRVVYSVDPVDRDILVIELAKLRG